MFNALQAKNKLGFIDGRLEKPAETAEEYGAWKICNATVIAWIFNSFDTSLHASVAYAGSWKGGAAATITEEQVQQIQQLLAMLGQNNKSTLEQVSGMSFNLALGGSNWILDTGATRHITGNDQTTRKVIGVAKLLGELYYFGCVAAHSTLASFEGQDLEKWHMHLGHPS
ncbi:hypothetical protein CRG98_019069 [Punica granatum]|uniref:Retrotransposon Copia-like N-terminal domain-containing protein n=1 Tax=Punica granatum TaxID=22663 RepID=A0A2I0JXL9_PUNGR|nr:hypothetical protein CRG98_019069 [Punica granatum]